jgi:hypothetical protein
MPAPAGFTAVAGTTSVRGKNLFLFEFPPSFDTSIMADVTLDIPVTPTEGVVCRFVHESVGYVVMELSKHHNANFVSLFPAKGESFYEPSAAIRRGFRIALEAHAEPVATKAHVLNRIPSYPDAAEIAPPFLPIGHIEEGSATDTLHRARNGEVEIKAKVKTPKRKAADTAVPKKEPKKKKEKR